MVRINKEELLEIISLVSDIPCIVEGKRDRAALNKLGFKKIVELDAALFEVVERFETGSTVQILTDLDKEGRGLYQRLKTDLTNHGIKIDDRLREALFTTELSHIEGLDSYLEKI